MIHGHIKKAELRKLNENERIRPNLAQKALQVISNTRDSRLRSYVTAAKNDYKIGSKKMLENIERLEKRCDQLEARKPEQNQAVTLETQTTQVIKETLSKKDRLFLGAVAIISLLNIMVIILK